MDMFIMMLNSTNAQHIRKHNTKPNKKEQIYRDFSANKLRFSKSSSSSNSLNFNMRFGAVDQHKNILKRCKSHQRGQSTVNMEYQGYVVCIHTSTGQNWSFYGLYMKEIHH